MRSNPETSRSSMCSSDAATRRIADALSDVLRAWGNAGTQAVVGTTRVAANVADNVGSSCCAEPASRMSSPRAARDTGDRGA